jgi:flagellar biosynthesis chaperone FliJ
MPVSPGLKRLLCIRELEEELSQAALERAVAEREHFERNLGLAIDRKRAGRSLWSQGVEAGESENRQAGLEEMGAAGRLAACAFTQLAEAEKQVSERRESYLATRTRRHQAQTLIEETRNEDARTALRRDQQQLDEWFRLNSKSAADQEERKSGGSRENF